MTIREQIVKKITRELSPELLEVIDESYKHEGHAGSRPEGETHFAMLIVSSLFSGKNRIERHKIVQKTLKEELGRSIHALRFIGLFTEEEHMEK